MTVTVPFEKGWGGVQYRTQLGLHRHRSGDNTIVFDPEAPAWDVFVGPLPFLLAPSDTRPYGRESTPSRRDRFDNAREPGENSLDSNLWLRSWTSWHLGAGQEWTEPLETNADVARFRFHRSAGIDPWTAGQASLLHGVTSRRTDARSLTAHPVHGVVASSAAGIRLLTDTTDTQMADEDCGKVTVDSTRWFGVTTATGAVKYGPLAGGTASSISSITGATALQVAKDRLWVGAGAALYELTDPGNPSITPFHTFSGAGSKIIDIDTGAGGLYVMVDQGLTVIYVVTVADDATLNPPREVAVLPRGERGTMLYGYLSKYLLVGTTAGIRVADCSEPATLPLGPILIDIEGGASDATAHGNFAWVTGGTERIDTTGDGTVMRPGLYRLDLSRLVVPGQLYGDTAASRYAYATDLYTPNTGTRATAVTVWNGTPFFVVDSNLWMQDDAYLPAGYLDLGKVTFSTSERKAWQSMQVEVADSGKVGVFADTGAGFTPLIQTSLPTPITGDFTIDNVAHPASGWLGPRVTLSGDTLTSPILLSVLLRAMVAPKRTRYIQLPLMCFDSEVDRNNSPVGYESFAYHRIKDLEDLEKSGQIVPITDARTGETINGQIEKIRYDGTAAPDRGRSNFGGLVMLTMLMA